MALTGDAGGPPLDPGTEAAEVADRLLEPFGLDARVLSERAAHLGLRRRGSVSCGGAHRLLLAADGWFALALARPEDLELLPAFLQLDRLEGDPWQQVEQRVSSFTVAELVEQGELLGLPVAGVGTEPGTIRSEGAARSDVGRDRGSPLVVDLSALWAGPLATHLLGRYGARVVKVESTSRPDGARRGVRSFFDLLNAGKASVTVPLGTETGRERLRRLVERADIVVSSSRRRAIEQLGLDPAEFLAGGVDRVWVAITAHGWDSNRVGFGDDTAAAAGLVAHGRDGQPRFLGDAIADPLCGIVAADEVRRAWAGGGRWFLDVPLTGAAARFRPRLSPAREAVRTDSGWMIDGGPVVEPVARPPAARAAVLGADNAAILGLSR